MSTAIDDLKILPFSVKVPWFQAVAARQLRNGKWRAYIFEEANPDNPRYCSWKHWTCRALEDYFAEAPSLEALIDLLKRYPYFVYKPSHNIGTSLKRRTLRM